MRSRWPLILVGSLTVLGLILRLHQYGQPLFGDELSTLWVVEGRGLGDVFDLVSGDGEITPPLYFILAWFTTKLGSAPELVRLPALIAGTACIPLTYLLGLRTVGRDAGLVAAALVTLSPFMVFFAGSGRAYTLMLALLLGSALAMLAAARTGRTRWWVAYAVLACLAVYAHYTAAFVLGAQFLWLLWAEPAARRPALVATAAAAVAFLPWLPSAMADFDSPTVELLEALQGDGFGAKRVAVEQWVFGRPLLDPSELPGRTLLVIMGTALLAAAIAWAVRVAGRRIPVRRLIRENRPVVLVVALALATPVGELALMLLGSDLFGSRNLTASWPGLGLAIGTMITGAGLLWGGLCGLVLIGGFAAGAVQNLGDPAAIPDYRVAADLIEERAEPGDVAVDLLSPPVSPVPLTPLGTSLEGTPLVQVNHPEGDPPFLLFTPPVPDPSARLDETFDAAGDSTVFLVGPEAEVTPGADGAAFEDGDVTLPRGWKVVSEETLPGVFELKLVTVSRD